MEIIENTDKKLSDRDLKTFLFNVLNKIKNAGKVLIVHTDYTRVDFTDKIVPILLENLKKSGTKRFDFLNAGGTHREMSEIEFLKKLGLKRKENCLNFYNHEFNNPDKLEAIGNIPSKLVEEKTSGHLTGAISFTVNRLILGDYDLIIAISGTVPHEASGYSGGLKIFLPGLAGPEVIDLFHWAAVLIGLPDIIGTIDNNARDIINEGSSYIFKKVKAKIISFNMVSTEESNKVTPVGLYIDSGFDGFIRAYGKAASTSAGIHVKYINGPLRQAVQVIPAHYDEIWTAGKGSYKLQKQGIMAEGGEVILYAPHIRYFHSNDSMNNEIISLGYHCRDKICHLLKSRSKISRNAAAHVINVAGPGIFNKKTNKEKLHFNVILASGIPEEVCESVGFKYRDPKTINKKDYIGPGKLWIDEGGKYLYELKK
ncbi:MAG: lactate racemase domain-containing protein [Actinomycetota bacterium]|nr:lactate racemase domain-containing protein [Actinomycetota bacterium]